MSWAPAWPGGRNAGSSAAPRRSTVPTPPTAPGAPAASPDVPRPLHGRKPADVLAVVGALAGGLALAWILCGRLLPIEGLAPYLVVAYLCFVGLYVLLTLVEHDRVELADRMSTLVVTSLGLFVGGALCLVVGYTVARGLEAMGHVNFYTQDLSGAGPQQPLTQGGILHAIVGSLIEIAIAIAISLPLGVLTAVYLTEVRGRGARVVRTVVEAMTALPSIVAGLFVYIVLLLVAGLPLSGFLAGCALSVMMLPIIARAAEVVLRLVPNGLREASLALGASQWQTVWRVVLPTARPGLATALVLGTARGIGETSPVLLTAGYTTYLNANPLDGPMSSLPLLTFMLARSPEATYNVRAFGAAAVLLLLVLTLFALARWVAARGVGGSR